MITKNVELLYSHELIIEIDETIWNEEYRKEWSNSFWDIEEIDDLIGSIAVAIVENGYKNFHEGFGFIQLIENNEIVPVWTSYYGELKKLEESDYCEGIRLLKRYIDDDPMIDIKENSNS